MDWRKNAGRELRKLHCEYQQKRIAEVLGVCRAWGVHLVVFPEYSVPPECLEALLPLTRDMTVVFGTHAVEPKLLSDGLYARIGSSSPQPGTSVAPVAINGALHCYQPKLNKTHLERDMLLGVAWDTIDIANPITLKLGVLICLDYLSRDAAPFRAYVGDKIGACRLLAVPSLTPHHTIGEFNARSTSEAKRLGRAVVYANIANGGGTSILVDSGMDMPHAEFPYGIPELARCEEGVVVADIDCELTAPDEKPSRLFSDRTAAVPIAAALLRYATVEEEVSANTQMARIFGQCDMNSCLSLSNAVESNDAALRQLADESPQTRQLRLNMLLDRHDQFREPEDFLRLLRDVPLSEAVYPSSDVDALRLEVAEHLASTFKTTNDDAEAMDSIRRRLAEQRRGGMR
jgi:predicted amidohydrolase